MMETITGNVAILYPGFALAFYTLLFMGYLGSSRFRAVQRREISLGYYRSYTEGREPDRLRVLTRHQKNLFEVPLLFYVVLLIAFVTGQVTSLGIMLAWLYFLARCVHAFIHLGRNDVNHRFAAFGISMIILLVLWLEVFINVVSAGR